MTPSKEQIIQLAEQFFTCNCSVMEYSAKQKDILKFALVIHEDGYNKGYDKGYDEGWESSKVSTEMNTWSDEE